MFILIYSSPFHSSVCDRVFIDHHKCRKLLFLYSKTATDNDALLSFSEDDLAELLQLLSIHSPVLVPLIQNTIPCQRAYAPLLKSLSTLSPVCALIVPTPTTLELVEALIEGCEVRSNPDLWCRLQYNIPIIFKLMIDLDVTSIPEVIRPVISEMKKVAKRPYDAVKAECNDTAEAPTITEGDDCCYYPNLPQCRQRGFYASDKSSNISTCTKVHRGHPSLLPGIFTIFCPHGTYVLEKY